MVWPGVAVPPTESVEEFRGKSHYLVVLLSIFGVEP
jgi:hypothetical protein